MTGGHFIPVSTLDDGVTSVSKVTNVSHQTPSGTWSWEPTVRTEVQDEDVWIGVQTVRRDFKDEFVVERLSAGTGGNCLVDEEEVDEGNNRKEVS